MKNATIEIVAGHSEQNEPVFVCLGREYRFCFLREYSFLRKKTKKIENWPCQRNIADQGTFISDNLRQIRSSMMFLRGHAVFGFLITTGTCSHQLSNLLHILLARRFVFEPSRD